MRNLKGIFSCYYMFAKNARPRVKSFKFKFRIKFAFQVIVSWINFKTVFVLHKHFVGVLFLRTETISILHEKKNEVRLYMTEISSGKELIRFLVLSALVWYQPEGKL